MSFARGPSAALRGRENLKEHRFALRRALTSTLTVQLLAILLASQAGARPEALFPPQDSVQKRLVAAIDHCTRSVDVAMYELSAAPLVRALQHAGERGVTVRILLDANTLREHPHVRISGQNARVSLRTLKGRTRRRGIMHNKFAILDGALVATGSYNWTQGAEYANYENALLEDDPDVVGAYIRQFESLWSQAAAATPGAPTLHSRRSSVRRTSRRSASPGSAN